MDDGFGAKVSWGDDGGVVHLTGTVNRLAKDGLENLLVRDPSFAR